MDSASMYALGFALSLGPGLVDETFALAYLIARSEAAAETKEE